MVLNHEIQAIQAEASMALDAEFAGDASAALQGYMRAASQLRYLLDVVVPRSQPSVGAACMALLDTYAGRAEALKARGVQLPQQQQQQQQPAATRQPPAAGGASSSPPADANEKKQPAAAAAACWESASAASTSMEDPSLPPPLHNSLAAAFPPAADYGLAWAMGAHGAGLMSHALQPQLVGVAGGGGCFDMGGGGGGFGNGNGGGGGGGGGGAAGGQAQQNAAALEMLHLCQRRVAGGLDDVVGHDAVKDELEEAVLLPMRYPQLFRGIRRPPRTFLLYGPPGTGKTLLVEKVAAEAGLALLSLSPASIMSKWSGESEKALAAAFSAARAMAPAALLLDEVDALGAARGGGGGGGGGSDDAAGRRLLTELLLQLNGLARDGDSAASTGASSGGAADCAGASDGVFVFAATNRMADVDAALLRRFERRIEVPLPDARARQAFIAAVLARPEIDSKLGQDELDALAAATEGFSGSDMECLCRQAAMGPVRELLLAARGAGGGKRRRRLQHGGGGGGGGGSGGGAGSGSSGQALTTAMAAAQVRKLSAADFTEALKLVRPAAHDARDGGGGGGGAAAAAARV